MTLRRVLLVVGLALLVGCGGDGGHAAAGPPKGEPYIQGTIRDVVLASPAPGEGGAVGTILIAATGGGNQASLTIAGDTPIWETFGGGLERSRYTRLAEGQTVSAWVSGPVAESFPVQATADAIVIVVE